MTGIAADDRTRAVADSENHVGRGVVGSVHDDRLSVRSIRVEPPCVGGDLDPRIVLIRCRSVRWRSLATADDDASIFLRDFDAWCSVLRLLSRNNLFVAREQ